MSSETELARELFRYDEASGQLFWRVNRGRTAKAGQVAGHVDSKHRYRVIRFLGRLTMAHRIAWLYVHGVWPSGDIDHINGVRDDNRIENLRDVSRSANLQNQRQASRNNKCGMLGVSLHKETGKFVAQIMAGRKQKYLGLFDTAEEAHAAYLRAKAELHPFQTIAKDNA